MPMDRSKYPDNWEEISARIRHERAKDECEQCGAPNHAWIVRSDIDAAYYLRLDLERDCFRWPSGEVVGELPSEYATTPTVQVILTVHHIGATKPDGSPGSPEDKMDCRDENLAALCQRCHLLADLPLHQAKRHVTLNRKKHEARLEAGQGELF
jgi:hypothetical protein